MDSVPFDFSERVLATRKCCGKLEHCVCAKPLPLAAPRWNQAKGQTQLWFSFYIGPVNGGWQYGFLNHTNAENLSLDEMMKLKRVKNVRICWIGLVELARYEFALKVDVLDLQKLLNFVSFLSNEPRLYLGKRRLLQYREGCTILKWLEGKSFSTVFIPRLTPDYHKIVENQIGAQKEPTEVWLIKAKESAEFLRRRLMSGDLKRIALGGRLKLSSTALKRIVKNVLKDPESYRKQKLSIKACFDDSVSELMRKLSRQKRCNAENEFWFWSYRFDKGTPVLRVRKLENDFWLLSC